MTIFPLIRFVVVTVAIATGISKGAVFVFVSKGGIARKLPVKGNKVKGA